MLKIVEEPIVYCVSLWLQKKEYKVFFTSKEEKTAYIKNENIYCLKELIEHTASLTKERRGVTNAALNARRYAFAIAEGFINSTKAKYELRKKLLS